MGWWDGCDTVQCGFWVNWTQGYVRGTTLTLPSQLAMVLIAFSALFVKLAGSYLWGIICFAVHQVNASSRVQDDIYHQFQLVLRNCESESSFVAKLLKVGFAHKGARLEAYRRSFWLIALAVSHGVSMWVAGGLSSRFIAGSDEVQAVPGKCGWMKEARLSDMKQDSAVFETINSLVVMARYRYRRSAAYSRTCYGQMGGISSLCATFKRRTLPYTTNTSASCPFDQKICNGSAIYLDTGLLRSDDHLGINTQPKDAVSIRKALTCAPLAGEKYTDGWQDNPSIKNDIMKCYNFGHVLGTNYDPTDCVGYHWWLNGDQMYNLWSATSYVNYQGDQADIVELIPELRSTDSDVSVISLNNRAAYPTPVEDAFFNAQNFTPVAVGVFAGTNLSSATEVASWLGCQERYQFCTVDGTNCSPFTGLYNIDPSPQKSPTLNPTQKALFQLLWKMAWVMQLSFQILSIGAENLLAGDYLWGGNVGLSAPLPSNQWQKEVMNWMNTSLATLQSATYNFARPYQFDVGPGIPSLQYIVEPDSPDLQLLCSKIKFHSGAHTSFSVLGLFLILGISLFIIALNLTLPALVSVFQQRSGRGLHKRLEWIETSALQLQRMAAEGRGVGPWNGRENEVPTLAEFGRLFNLTAQSLKSRWNRTGSYEMVAQAETGRFDMLSPPGYKDVADTTVREVRFHDIRSRTDESQTNLLGR